jgi:hypothetical protein
MAHLLLVSAAREEVRLSLLQEVACAPDTYIQNPRGSAAADAEAAMEFTF